MNSTDTLTKKDGPAETRLRNKGPRRLSWEKDMVWSVRHYQAAEPARCENCGKPAVRLTEDGINLCRECYALCPEDTQNTKGSHAEDGAAHAP